MQINFENADGSNKYENKEGSEKPLKQGQDNSRCKKEPILIFYNKNKLYLIEQGTKRLSPTSDVLFTSLGRPSDGFKRTLTYII